MNNLGFGAMLKEYRKRHQLTQKELAEKMNISSNHLSVLELEQKIPRAKTIEAFEQLIREEEEKPRRRNADNIRAEWHEYAKLIACLDRLDVEKRKEAKNAIIRLLKLM